MPKCDFNKVAKRCTPVNLLYILEHLWTAASEKCNTGFQFEKSPHMHYISTHS